MNRQNYIITGGGGSGKTTLINALYDHGFQTMPEVSRQVIMQQQSINGTMVPWKDLKGFGALCLTHMEMQLNNIQSDMCFFDRGIPDIHAYFKCNNVDIPEHFNSNINQYAPIVFICPPWEAIFVNDDQRPESFTYSVEIYKQLKIIYRDFGFEVLKIPRLNVDARMEFVIEFINGINLLTNTDQEVDFSIIS